MKQRPQLGVALARLGVPTDGLQRTRADLAGALVAGDEPACSQASTARTGQVSSFFARYAKLGPLPSLRERGEVGGDGLRYRR